MALCALQRGPHQIRVFTTTSLKHAEAGRLEAAFFFLPVMLAAVRNEMGGDGLMVAAARPFVFTVLPRGSTGGMAKAWLFVRAYHYACLSVPGKGSRGTPCVGTLRFALRPSCAGSTEKT